MIRHHPHGAEHPYAVSPDQRVPTLPVHGQAVRLGVVAEPEVTSVRCELVVDHGTAADVGMQPLERGALDGVDAAALAGGDGHLAGAQASATVSDGAWRVDLPPVSSGATYRYRFHADSTKGESSSEWFEFHPGRWVPRNGGLRASTDRLIPDSVEWLIANGASHRVRFALQLDPDEHVVGFGERFDAVDQRGRRLDSVVFEQYKSQGKHGRTYLPMPFAHVIGESGGGWGFHVRTSRRVWFDVAASVPDRLIIEVALGGTSQEELEVAVYQGSPRKVLAAFTEDVGRAEELPAWVFQLWASGNEWNTQQIVMGRMDRHRELDIPLGAVVVEAWSDEHGITIFRDAQYEIRSDGSAHSAEDFHYPHDGAWPDPVGMIEELHRRGIRVLLWQIPLLKTRHDLGPEVPETAQVLCDGEALEREGHAVLEADGTPYHNRGWWFPQALMPDLSTQRTRDWWTEKRRYLVRSLDIDGFKTDGGEHAWGHDLRYGDGRRGDEGNNLYPVHYARAFGDLLRSEGKAPVTFSRAGFTGSQAHGVFWAGDEDSSWEAFRNSVVAGITASACGIVYWGWDLAGFSGDTPEPELYLRAAGTSAFMPIMQYHSEFHHHQPPLRDRTPWNVAERADDESVIPIFRRFAHLRERLVDYLVTEARKATSGGPPLMRGLFFEHREYPEAWRYPFQYQLGDALLVVPVMEPGAEHAAAWLPPGEWIHVWSGRKYTGAQEITLPAPIDEPPVLCRTDRWEELGGIFTTKDAVNAA